MRSIKRRAEMPSLATVTAALSWIVEFVRLESLRNVGKHFTIAYKTIVKLK